MLISLLIVLAINFSGCGNQSNQEAIYEKKNETFSLETEPKSYRKYALVSSGNIEVKKLYLQMAKLKQEVCLWIFQEKLHHQIILTGH
ncbi:MAG: hypothetical protein FAF05_02480 [Epsilonproteobacteria bacterium]|nr:hypothetical protein [Campylobacterota bacterium]